MRGEFDYRDLAQPAQRHDTELTLGATTLLMIFFGLVLLCGVCFGLGYATGHRGAQTAAATLDSAADPVVSADAGHSKPTANAQVIAPSAGAVEADAREPSNAYSSSPATVDTGAPGTHATGASVTGAGLVGTSGTGASGTGTSGAGTSGTGLGGQAASALQQVKPALGAALGPIQGAQPAAGAVGPALTVGGSLMVQIAAISEQQDADVLLGALRRRGYAVVGRREPLDGLIHVRIGPFKTRDEAETWRQKLLNDGYNAIVQD